MRTYPKVLSIAGSDCSGGAGIQADLKTFSALGVYGMSVITALTAQNTMAVTDVVPTPAEHLAKELDAIFSDIRPDAIKIGMSVNAEIINVIADKLIEYNATNIILDPVMISTSGHRLIGQEAISTLTQRLMPICTLLTPNRPAPSPAQEIPSSGGKTGGGKPSHTTTTPAAELTEEQKIQKQINDLVQQGMTMDEQGRSAQREKIAALQTQLEGYKKIKDELLGIEKKEKEVKPEKPTYTQAFSGGAVSLPSIQAYVSGLQSEIANTDIGSDLFNNLTEKMADAGRMSEVLKAAMDSGVQGVDLTSIAQEMKAKLLEGDISDEDWQAFLDNINEKIDNSDLKLKLDVDTEGIVKGADEQKKLSAETQKAWNMAAQSVGNLSTALNSIEDPAAKAAGTVIKAIADIALGFAQASVQAGAMGPWGWVAWLVAGTAALATTISTVHSLTGLANGGIVPGNSLSGDNVYGGGAMVNSGELVLNKAQQGNLASQLTDSAVQGFGGQPYVEGEKIFLGMNNSSRARGRGEIVTTKTLKRMGLIR